MDIITLDPSRWIDYKKLRLEALSEHPRIAFQSDYEQEAAYADNIWQNKLENREEQYLFFAQNNGTLCGMINGMINQGRAINHRAIITSLYVAPSYRETTQVHYSLVTKLLDALIADPRIIRVEVTVNAKNPVALEFYEQLGFAKVGLLKKYVRLTGSEFQDRYLLERILEK